MDETNGSADLSTRSVALVESMKSDNLITQLQTLIEVRIVQQRFQRLTKSFEMWNCRRMCNFLELWKIGLVNPTGRIGIDFDKYFCRISITY